MVTRISETDSSHYYHDSSVAIHADMDSAVVYGNFFHALTNSIVLLKQVQLQEMHLSAATLENIKVAELEKK